MLFQGQPTEGCLRFASVNSFYVQTEPLDTIVDRALLYGYVSFHSLFNEKSIYLDMGGWSASLMNAPLRSSCPSRSLMIAKGTHLLLCFKYKVDQVICMHVKYTLKHKSGLMFHCSLLRMYTMFVKAERYTSRFHTVIVWYIVRYS